MYDAKTQGVFRYLVHQGLSTVEICRELRISRQTAYNWSRPDRLGAAGKYGPRWAAGSILDSYKELIACRISEFPKLSAVRLFAEAREAGYRGGYDLIKQHLREVRPRLPVKPVVRFETPPGLQGQVDFAEFQLPWGKRFALLVVLGYSRMLWCQFYKRQTMEVLMRGLEAAFAYFGGVPWELLFDQMKAVIIKDRRGAAGELLRNEEFGRFAQHWAFKIRACRPYRAQTKGKVERPILYLRDGFFYARNFVSDGDLNDQALRWLDRVANVRIHGTLKEVPSVRFEEERLVLRPLAERRYSGVSATPIPVVGTGAGVTPARGLVPVERRCLSEYRRIAEDQA